MSDFIKNFSELGKNDMHLAGGKGASLGEMTQAGISVPSGFVITTKTFDKFFNTEIPKEIEEEILREFEKLNSDFVAVRSSATTEDSSTASWAGQLESFLNTDKNHLLGNVKKCWASLFTPRAIVYHMEKGMYQTKVSVAVVVQAMIQSDVSGICFTVHPVTKDKNQMIIEAGYGLGEAIVSGQITPDSYVIHKDFKIIDINVTGQENKIIRNPDSGNHWIDVEKNLQGKQKLTNVQIVELAKICMDIEKHYGFPCDIEWGFVKNKFYILQSRPITTL
jgi:pyruvate,water dikinase